MIWAFVSQPYGLSHLSSSGGKLIPKFILRDYVRLVDTQTMMKQQDMVANPPKWAKKDKICLFGNLEPVPGLQLHTDIVECINCV